jgi:hypothetical protein
MRCSRRRLRILAGLGGLYLGFIGFFTGMVVERMRFDHHRAAVVQSLTATRDRLHARLMDLEHRTKSPRLLDER